MFRNEHFTFRKLYLISGTWNIFMAREERQLVPRNQMFCLLLFIISTQKKVALYQFNP